MILLWKHHHQTADIQFKEDGVDYTHERGKRRKHKKKKKSRRKKGGGRGRHDLDLSSDTSYFTNEDTQEMFRDFSLFWQWRKRQKGGRDRFRGARHDPIAEEGENVDEVPARLSNNANSASNADSEANFLRLSRESMDLLSKESVVTSNAMKQKKQGKQRKQKARQRRELNEGSQDGLDISRILVESNRHNPNLVDTWSTPTRRRGRDEDMSHDSLGLDTVYWREVKGHNHNEENSGSDAESDLGLGVSYWNEALLDISNIDNNVETDVGVEPKTHSDFVDNTDDVSVKLSVGTKIEARYGGKQKWYKGAIAKVNGNGTYDIKYEDGDSERAVRTDFIRRI